MFFTLAIISALGYALHNSLMTHFARKLNILTLISYRNVAFALIMLPLLFFIPKADLPQIAQTTPLLLISALLGTIAIVFRFQSYRFLPLAVAQTIGQTRIIVIAVIAAVFLGEILTMPEIILGVAIIIGTSFLKINPKNFPHLNDRTSTGYLLAIADTILLSISITLFAEASRQSNAILSAYFWELYIGGFAILGLVIQNIATKKPLLPKIPLKTFFQIAIISSLIGVGTVGYAQAVKFGPLAIIQAIGVSGVIFSAIFAHIFYNEKLQRREWTIIFFVTLGIAALNFV